MMSQDMRGIVLILQNGSVSGAKLGNDLLWKAFPFSSKVPYFKLLLHFAQEAACSPEL